MQSTAPQTDFVRKFYVMVYVVILVGSVLLLLTARPLSQYEILGFDFGHLAREVGFAGIVALILIFSVDGFSRARQERETNALLQKMNAHLFHAIYRRSIPDTVLKEVEKIFRNSNVFRRQHEVHYTMESFAVDGQPECERHVKCSVTSRYVVSNTTDGPIKFPITLKIERPIDKELEKYCEIKSVKVDGQPLEAEVVARETGKTENQIVFVHDHPIPYQGRLEVETEAVLVKRKIDQEIWCSRLPSDGIKLTVTVPRKDLKVRANALHQEQLKKIHASDVTMTWELKHSMIPFQSVVFWWSDTSPLTCPKK